MMINEFRVHQQLDKQAKSQRVSIQMSGLLCAMRGIKTRFHNCRLPDKECPARSNRYMSLVHETIKIKLGHVIAQAVSRRLPTESAGFDPRSGVD